MAELLVGCMPIGDIKDLSLRMIQLLSNVDLLVVENKDYILDYLSLNNIETTANVFELGNHDTGLNMQDAVNFVKGSLDANESVLIISDDGSPAFADPTGELIFHIKQTTTHEIKNVPGPSALISMITHVTSHISHTNDFLYKRLPTVGSNFDDYISIIKQNSNIPILSITNGFEVLDGIFDQIIQKYQDLDILVASNMSRTDEECIKLKMSELADRLPKGPFMIAILPTE